MVQISSLANDLMRVGQSEAQGFCFEVNPIPGEVEVLQVVVEDREELPIFISASSEQILCIAFLFELKEVKEESVAEMNQAMLTSNISVPLSAFGILEGQYVIYGALSTQSSLEDVVHELETLSNNTLEAIEAMRDFLK